MKVQFTDDTEEFYMYSSRFYAQDKAKSPAPAKEQYEHRDKKRIKSKDNYQEQRKLKRGEQ